MKHQVRLYTWGWAWGHSPENGGGQGTEPGSVKESDPGLGHLDPVFWNLRKGGDMQEAREVARFVGVYGFNCSGQPKILMAFLASLRPKL